MHKLLERQLRRHLGEGAAIPEAWQALLADVDAAYREADEERDLMERSLDLTSHDLMERNERLRESHQRFQAVLENASDVTLIMTGDARIAYVSPSIQAVLGYTPAEVTGESMLAYVPVPERRVLLTAFARGRQRPGEAVTVDARCRHRDGSLRYLSFRGRSLFDHPGIGGVLINIRDVTERKRAEAALKEAHDELERRVEARTAELRRANDDLVAEVAERERAEAEVRALHTFYEELLSSLPAAIAVLDREGRYRFLNEGAIADPDLRAWLIGKTEVDYCRYRGHDVEIGRRRYAHVQEVIQKGRTVRYEEALMTSKGKRHFLRYLAPIRDADGAVVSVVGYGTDVTEMKEAEAQLRQRLHLEQALRASETRYRALVDNMQEVVFQTDADGRWTLLNPAWSAITGFAVEESLGRPFLDAIHPDDRAANRQQFKLLIGGEQAGSRHEARYLTKEGDCRHIEVQASLLRDDDGAVTGTSGTLRDITDSVRFEAEREARQRAEELLRLKTSFLNNMSHELRTPLTGILGFADVLAEEVGSEHREFVGVIRQSAKRLLETLNSVLDLARLEGGGIELRPEPLDLTAEVQEALLLLRPLAEQKGIALRSAAPAPGLRARVDRACFRRMLFNLVGNAIKFTDEGGVTVELSAEAGEACVEVRDTGAGIDPAFFPLLFEEFRQESTGLDRSHEGSGLGLAITKRLVDLSGGAIDVQSQKGEGSLFTLRFPHIRASSAPAGDAPLRAGRMTRVEGRMGAGSEA